MTNPTPVQAQGGAAVPALQITGLTKQFGGLRAVGNFDLTVQPGALDGLIGPNGAGKTTVFNMISGLYVPTGGEVDLYGEPLVGLEPFEITQMGIGRTFQNIRLFPNLTVLDNVLIAYHPHAGYGLFDGLLRTARFGRKEREMVDRARVPGDLRLGADPGSDGAQSSLRRTAPRRDRPCAGGRSQAAAVG